MTSRVLRGLGWGSVGLGPLDGGPELVEECRQGGICIRSVRGQRDLAVRADRQAKQGDETLRVGGALAGADRDPALETARGADELGRRPGVESCLLYTSPSPRDS